MTLLQLKYISTVAKCGSFSKAAQSLYISQPGISKMVCALEEELGITIFVRSSSGITLTAEGRQLLDMGERLLRDADRITDHFTQEAVKSHEILSVSSQHYCFVVDAFTGFLNSSDKEFCTYKLLIGPNPNVVSEVADKTSELGILFLNHDSRQHMQRVFEENDLEFHELGESIPYVFFHETHPLAQKDTVSLEELQPYPCIMYELDSDSPSILQEEIFVSDFSPKKVVIVNGLYQSAELMIKCQAYDLGTGGISPGNDELGIVRRRVEGVDTPISIGWICQKSHILSSAAAKFINYLQIYASRV